MSGGAIDALNADRGALLSICETLTVADWKADSGCAGWSVQDVVGHMGALFWEVVDPSSLPDTGGAPNEQGQEIRVAARRSWSAERVVDDYESVSKAAIDALEGLETQDFEIPLGDLGTYPASLIPNAFSFDHYTHIRADLFAPRGPLTTTPPPSDELRLVPAIDWIVAALPQQNAELVASLPGSIEIALSGPAARRITVGSGAAGDPVARIESDAPSFVRWVTQRGSWDDLGVVTTGDEASLALAQTLHVF